MVLKMLKPFQLIGIHTKCLSLACLTLKRACSGYTVRQANLFKLGRMPAQVIVDKAGIARYVHYGHDMTDIPSNAEVLELLDDMVSVYA